jgi:hypothetical protein
MAVTGSCPGCGGTQILVKKVRINPKTDEEMRASRWLTVGIGLLVMVCIWIPLFTNLMVKSPHNYLLLIVNGVVVLGGLIGGIYVLVRYSRAHTVRLLVCQDCGKRWQSAEVAKVAEVEERRRAGDVSLAFRSLEPATYNQAALGLANPDTCIYCGAHAEVQLPNNFTYTEKVGEKSNIWTFNWEFPFCKEHASISKRNSNIETTAMVIGGIVGVVLEGVIIASDPEAVIYGLFKFLSYFLPQYWMALIMATVIALGFIALVAAIVMFLIWWIVGIFSKTMRHQGVLLGLHHRFTNKKELVLSFARPETAAAYADLNQAALQSLEGQAQAIFTAEALAARPELVKAAEVAEEELIQAEAACWYCQAHAPADGMPYNLVFYKMNGQERTEKTLWVPRCKACEMLHKRSDRSFAILGQVIAWSLMGVCVLIGLAGQGSAWGWIIGVVIAVVGFVVGVIMVRNRKAKQLSAAGTQVAEVAHTQFEEAKALLAEKWLVDTAKTGKAGAV